MGPEKAVMPRYEIRNGRFGDYFWDSALGQNMNLQEVLKTMNDLEDLILTIKRALIRG